MKRVFTLAALTLSMVASTSEAAMRYAIIFDETVAGKSDAPLAVESALSAALLEREATLIDESQSRKIRSVTSAGELIAGRVHEIVTTLDADVLVAGISRTERSAPPTLVKKKVVAFETHVTVKLIAIDTGEIVDTITLSETAFGTTEGQAIAAATRKTGELLASRILDSRAKASLAIELSVESLPSVTAARELVSVLSSVPEVGSAEIVHASTAITEYRILLAEGADTEALAGALEDSPLVITAFAERTVRARYASGHIQAARAASRGLRITSIEVKDVFPARAADHRRNGIGEVELANDGTRRIRGAVVRARIAGFTKEAVETKVPEIEPGARVRVPVRVALNEDRLAGHRDSRPATLTVEVSQGARAMARRTATVTVEDRRAMDWKVKDSVAAFVTSRNHALRSVAQRAIDAIPRGRRGHTLARGVALFELLRGLRYQRDAVYPGRADDLDEVLLPIETLQRGAGDCDDLAVLYAALAEAVGVRAALVLTPGHVLVAIDTELPEQAASAISIAPERLLLRNGRVWVPIETTLVDGTFSDAWARAAGTVHDSAGPDVIMVRDAWSRHPPVDWSPRASSPQVRVDATRIEDQLAAMDSARKADWDRALAALDRIPPTAEALNRRGLLMMAAGRVDEAEAAFTRAAERSDAGGEAINNLANVHLVRGRVDAALRGYDLVLRKTPRRGRVRLNAAIAARLAGNHARFAEEITDCLELNGGRELVQQFLSALEGFETTRGAAPDRVRLRGLAQAIRAVAESRKIDVRLHDSRASEDRPLRMEQVLFWLR